MKRRLLFATKVGGQLYMCEGGRKEKGGKGQYVPSRTVTSWYFQFSNLEAVVVSVEQLLAHAADVYD